MSQGGIVWELQYFIKAVGVLSFSARQNSWGTGDRRTLPSLFERKPKEWARENWVLDEDWVTNHELLKNMKFLPFKCSPWIGSSNAPSFWLIIWMSCSSCEIWCPLPRIPYIYYCVPSIYSDSLNLIPDPDIRYSRWNICKYEGLGSIWIKDSAVCVVSYFILLMFHELHKYLSIIQKIFTLEIHPCEIPCFILFPCFYFCYFQISFQSQHVIVHMN